MIEMLPKGWVVATLDDIADWSSGGTPKATEKKYYNGNIPWLIIADLNNGIVDRSSKQITEIGLHNSSTKWVEIGSVLIAMYGSIGKLGIAGIRCTTNQAIAFTSKIWGGIPNWYLFHYLKYQEPDLLSIGQGGAQKNISQTILKQYLIPLPPLNEQKRIVTKLDQIIPKIDLLKDRLDKIPTIIKRFRQSVLTAAVTGNLTEKWREGHPDLENGEERLERSIKESRAKKNISINYEDPTFDSAWNFLKLGVLFSKGDIFDGPFGSNLKTSDYTTEGVRVIRLENIEFLGFNNNKKTYISKFKYENLKRHTVFSGDIIFSSFISDTTRTVLLPELNEISLAKADCFCLRANEQLINKKYLTYILSSKHLHDYLQTQVHGATRPRINTTQLRNTPIPYPRLEEQKEIVRQVDKLFALADKLESHYQKAKARVDKLSQSILAKAFRGELVITEAELAEKEGRDFETAEKLLDRILEEKAKLVCSKKSAVKRKFVEGDKMVKKENRRNPK